MADAAAVEVFRLSAPDRMAEAMRRSLPLLPAEGRRMVEGLLSPASIAIVSGTLVLWVGSHAFGIGEIVDVLLLGVGLFTLGFAVFRGASELCEFAEGAAGARTNADLDRAAEHFARAVTLLGVSALQALLVRGQLSAVAARGRPQVQPLPDVGAPPPAGNQLRVTRPASLPGGNLGETDAFGVIQIARNQALTEQRVSLFHELVHRFFSPRAGPLRRLRAQVGMSAYERSAFLRYLEEALAEGYGQLRVHGLAQALGAWRFPLTGGYVTVSQLAGEGTALGTISLGGALFHVSISLGPMPQEGARPR